MRFKVTVKVKVEREGSTFICLFDHSVFSIDVLSVEREKIMWAAFSLTSLAAAAAAAAAAASVARSSVSSVRSACD